MEIVKEGWKNGPTRPLGIRDLQKPAKIKKDNVFFIAFWVAYLFVFVTWEIVKNIGFFFWRLIIRPKPKSLKRRVCLVTGSGRGLGREFCLALAKEGAILACVDINEPNNKTTAAMVNDLGGKAVPYTVNVAIKNDVEELVTKIERELGPIYLLINNAAIVGNSFGIDEELVRATFNINVLGPIWMMNAVLPSMKLRNEGHIVNISSLASKMTVSPLKIYGATKAALSYMSNCIRADLQLANQSNNIVVTTVCPSLMNSSEDYTNNVILNINLVVEMKEVVKAAMEAIHYNYDEVVVPSYLKFAHLFNEIMPSQTGTNLFRLFVKRMFLPTKEQCQQLSLYHAIKESCFLEDKNGDLN